MNKKFSRIFCFCCWLFAPGFNPVQASNHSQAITDPKHQTLNLTSRSCLGQTAYFQHYFLLRKNEPVQVNTIFQDNSGFMWYGTNKGLFKFDGVNQKRYRSADGLPDDNVTALAQDSAGRIWMGHKNGSLAFIEKGAVKKFEPKEGSAVQQVSNILFDRGGNMWFSTLGDGLYNYRQDRLFRLDENENMPDLFIYDIAEDRKGNIWVGTDRGVAICTLKDNTVSIRVVNYSNGLPDNIVKKLVIGEDGLVWMGTEDAGVVNYNPSTGKYQTLMKKKWDHGTITDFLLDEDRVWISCLQKGLAVYDQKTEQIKMYGAKAVSGLSPVNTLFRDDEGNIWAGTESGILRTPGDDIEYIETFESAKNTNVVAMAVDKQGSLWYSNSDGLYKKTGDESGLVVNEKQLVKTPFEKYSVISLFVDPGGYVWAGLYGQGVIRINPVTGKTQYLSKELRDGNVLNISGKDDVVWLATLGGVTEINISGEQLKIRNYNSGDGLISDFIYQVFIDSKNRTWFATDGRGVGMKDKNGFHHFEEGLNSKVVYGFAEDGEHHIWANVQGDGLYKFDGTKFQPLGSALLRDNNINCLSSDKSGNLVLMHNLGIDIYDIRKNKIRSFGDEVGIHDKTPNLNAVTKDDLGRILFGTDHGIVIYSDRGTHQETVPQPFIDGLRVLNKNVELSPDLILEHNQNNVTINYRGFWYRNPGNLNFKYKLENYDKDWITSRNHSVIYSSLPPGEYTFRLKTYDTEESYNMKESTFSFAVLPPFWQTRWFIVLSAIGGFLMVYGYIKLRETQLQKDKKVLEKINTELKKTNMELDQFVYSVSHDLRAPLTSMLGVVEMSEEETNEPMMVDHLKFLKGSIKKLDAFIVDILDYSRNARLEVKTEEINFKEMLHDITNNLKYMNGNGHKVGIKIEVSDEKPFYSDKNRVTVVLNNIISNAIRYHNSSITDPFVNIKVDTSDTETHIIVRDNGIGISKELHHKIFEMFYRISDKSVGSGLGLYIVKEMVDKLDGTIEVNSEPGQGTAFIIHIPNLSSLN